VLYYTIDAIIYIITHHYVNNYIILKSQDGLATKVLDDISKTILRKLLYDNRIGNKHISLENLKTGFPSHAKGDVDKRLKKLVKENLVLQHPTSYGPQFALNPRRVEEIIELLGIK